MSEKNENKQKDVGVCPFKNILGFFVPPGSYWKTNCAEITARSWCLILGIKLVYIYKFTQSRWKWHSPDTNLHNQDENDLVLIQICPLEDSLSTTNHASKS